MKVIKADISKDSKTPNIDVFDQQKTFDSMQERLTEAQLKVREYNTNINVVHSEFKHKTLMGQRLIIRLLKKPVVQASLGALISRPDKVPVVDGSGNRGKTINNPLPYKMKGIIVLASPDVTNFRTTTGETPFAHLTQGTLVEIEHVDLQTTRYYPNDNFEDTPMNMDDVYAGANPYPNFQGYFSISPQQVKAIYDVPKVPLIFETPADELRDTKVISEALGDHYSGEPKELGQ